MENEKLLQSADDPVLEKDQTGDWKVVAYLKTGSRAMVRDFFHHAERLGIAWVEAQDFALPDEVGHRTALLLKGTREALEELCGRRCIASWHQDVPAKLLFRAFGGPKK